MHLFPPVRRIALTAVTALLLTAASAPPSAPAPVSRTGDGLRSVALLSARRLAVADRVAAAKRGTDKPVQDPAREREVLASAAALARQAGADPAATVRVFRDQIEAGKDVQRALLRRWRDHPGEAPAARPALAGVRDQINRVDGALARALARSAAARTAPVCGGALAASTVRAAADERLDATHRAALHRSLRSVCGPSSGSGLRPRPVPEG